MNKYRRLLGSSRGGHFKEPRRKKMKFTASHRRQSISLRGRYGKLLFQRAVDFGWSVAKIVLIAGTAAWAVSFVLNTTRETKAFQLRSVVFEGDVPESLRQFLPFKTGANIFSIKPSGWEKASMAKFPEIEEISIYRTLFRNVVVEVRQRTPMALAINGEQVDGVDKNGIVFPMKSVPAEKLPAIRAGRREDRAALASLLISLKAKQPLFCEKITSATIDGGRVELGLEQGIVVEWGAYDEKNIFDKAKNILRLLNEFSPRKVPAKLTFVTPDRIVMDAHWEGK